MGKFISSFSVDVLTVLFIVCLSFIPISKLILISADFYSDSLEYQSTSILEDIYDSRVNQLDTLSSELYYYSCNYSEYSPEIAQYLYYNDYIGRYHDEWISNLTQSLDMYRVSVESWQEGIEAKIETVNEIIDDVNTQIEKIKHITISASLRIAELEAKLDSIRKALDIGTRKVRYRFRKKIAGVRVSFSVSIPVDLCVVIPEACKVIGDIDKVVVLLGTLKSGLTELESVTGSLSGILSLPSPPSIPEFLDYSPSEFVPYNRTFEYEDLSLATSGISYFYGDVDFQIANELEIGLLISGITLLSGVWTFLRFKLSRHYFYSVEEMIIKLERSKGLLLIMIFQSLLKLFYAITLLAILSSLYEDTSCNTSSLYLTAKINFRSELYNEKLLDSINSCLVCANNDSLCGTPPHLIIEDFSLPKCEQISHGFLNNVVISISLVLLYLVITSPSGIVKDILIIRSLQVSESPRRMSKTRRDEWISISRRLIFRVYTLALTTRFISMVILLSPLNPLLAFLPLLISKIMELAV